MWKRGERFAPITIDMALTRACQYSCGFCYAQLQENERKYMKRETVMQFLEDAAAVGVKGISFVSDGESTLHPNFVEAVQHGHKHGISMAVGSNGYALNEDKIRKILPSLTYFRFNFSGGTAAGYARIMGVKEAHFHKVCENVRTMMRVKKELGLNVSVGLQFVVDPRYHDEVIPLAELAKNDLRPDYLILKHCSDDENGSLGVDYSKYPDLYADFEKAEAMSDETLQITVKWNKIKTGNQRTYEQCYGAPFILQISGSGLVAPCGPLFNQRYAKFHMGNLTEMRFKDIVFSDRYWEVMSYLGSKDFNAKKMCASLCLQDLTNRYLDGVKKGEITSQAPEGALPQHINFI